MTKWEIFTKEFTWKVALKHLFYILFLWGLLIFGLRSDIIYWTQIR